MVKSERGGSNQTSWITVREGTGSIYSDSKAVCVERKWVRSASVMFITRLHVSTALAFLEATDRILKLYGSNEEQPLRRHPMRCSTPLMKYYKRDHMLHLMLSRDFL